MNYEPGGEEQYLGLLKHILKNGDKRIDRTGVGTLSVTGTSMRFDLSDGSIPVMTTKKVIWKAALIEMLWFLTGSTNIRPLLEQDVHIWTDWPLAKYRKDTGFDIDRKTFEARVLEDKAFADRYGSLGPVYGKNWRNWESKDGSTIDQIAECIRLIKEEPFSRRILFHAWKVDEIKEMALPPCHMVYQFTVTSNGNLNMILFQRSVDSTLGLPFNCCGAAFLLLMVAQQTDLKPGVIQWFGADTHIYLNHLDAVQTQLEREPKGFPKIRLTRKPDSIDGYKVEDFEITGYDPHAFIKASVAV